MEVRRARRVRAVKGARDVLSIAINPDHIEACYGILELPVDARPELVASSPELKRLANTLMVPVRIPWQSGLPANRPTRYA
jgi:hypothetical protein